jgi:hypothetical protein
MNIANFNPSSFFYLQKIPFRGIGSANNFTQPIAENILTIFHYFDYFYSSLANGNTLAGYYNISYF